MFLHLGIRGRAGIPRANMPMLREAKQVRRQHGKSAGTDDHHHHHHHHHGENFTESSSINDDKNDYHEESSTTWVPHPRTGIYFPEGNEWVLADVPKTAACLDRTFWLRNDEGVDKPDMTAAPTIPDSN